MIEEFPEFYRILKKCKYSVDKSGRLKINGLVKKCVPDSEQVCAQIYEKAQNFTFKNQGHLTELNKKEVLIDKSIKHE